MAADHFCDLEGGSWKPNSRIQMAYSQTRSNAVLGSLSLAS